MTCLTPERGALVAVICFPCKLYTIYGHELNFPEQLNVALPGRSLCRAIAGFRQEIAAPASSRPLTQSIG